MNDQVMLFITIGGSNERKNWFSNFFVKCSLTDNDGTRYLNDSELPVLRGMKTDEIEDAKRFSRICSFIVAKEIAGSRNLNVLSIDFEGESSLFDTWLKSYICILG